MVKKSVRAETTITFHGRQGKPKLHWTNNKRPYIMVRAKGGGTKRLYLDTKKAKREITTGFKDLISEGKRRVR